MTTISLLKKKRLAKALTGISLEEFNSLLPVFEQSVLEDKKLRSKAGKRHFGGGSKGRLATIEEKLFFVLTYVKTYPTFDFCGFIFGMHRSKAHANTIKLIGSLEKTLGRKIVLPEKQVSSMEEFLEKFPETKDVFVDGAERPIQRPVNKKRQNKLYSGKKKRHTRKTILAVNEKKKVLIATKTKSGRRHDKRLADKVSLFEHLPSQWRSGLIRGSMEQYNNTGIHSFPRKQRRGNR